MSTALITGVTSLLLCTSTHTTHATEALQRGPCIQYGDETVQSTAFRYCPRGSFKKYEMYYWGIDSGWVEVDRAQANCTWLGEDHTWLCKKSGRRFVCATGVCIVGR
jgi:hypothetical protein